MEARAKKLTPDGGVVKKVLVDGQKEGPKPTKGQEVLVHYEGRIENGKVFDSSYKRGDPFKINVGEGQVIKGWDIAIMEMVLGEKAELTIKADYGYGQQGAGADIPPGATLIFTVELLQIADRASTRWMMSDEEKLKEAIGLKEKGNEFFRNKSCREAEVEYKDAISYVEGIKSPTEESKTLQKTLY